MANANEGLIEIIDAWTLTYLQHRLDILVKLSRMLKLNGIHKNISIFLQNAWLRYIDRFYLFVFDPGFFVSTASTCSSPLRISMSVKTCDPNPVSQTGSPFPRDFRFLNISKSEGIIDCEPFNIRIADPWASQWISADCIVWDCNHFENGRFCVHCRNRSLTLNMQR